MSKSRSTRRVFLVGLMMVLFWTGCSSSTGARLSSSSSQSNDEAEGSFETAVGGNVQALSINAGTNTVPVTGVSSSGDVVLAIFSMDRFSSQNTFQLGSGTSSSLVKGLSAQVDDDSNATEVFHETLRAWESEADEDYFLESGSLKYAVKALQVGSVQEFKVLSSVQNSNDYEKVVAELRVQNQYFNFYVDVRDGESLTDANLADLAADFEKVIPTVNQAFGNESDVNGDGRFDVLFTRVVNQMGGSSGGIVTGFFYAIDLFESDKYPASNSKEVINVIVPDPSGKFGSPVSTSFAIKNIIKGVLPHEYQHMISFNMHYFVNGGLAEKSWLNEALSHIAEDFHTMNSNDDLKGFGLENGARVSSYLSSLSNVCFTCSTSLSARGGSYLFVKYIYEQAQQGRFDTVSSGLEFLQNLLNTNLRSFDNINQVLFGDENADADFKSLLGSYALALYLSDSGESANSQFQFSGISLRGSLNDNRGTYLNGASVQSPASLNYTDNLTGTGITFIQIGGDLLADNGGEFELSVSDSEKFGAYLIK